MGNGIEIHVGTKKVTQEKNKSRDKGNARQFYKELPKNNWKTKETPCAKWWLRSTISPQMMAITKIAILDWCELCTRRQFTIQEGDSTRVEGRVGKLRREMPVT